MNLIDTFLAENENFKYVSVVFAPYTGKQEYTYKTLLDFQAGDFAVVDTPSNGYQVVQVRSVYNFLDAEVNPNIKYKWVVQKLDLADYAKMQELSAAIEQRVRKAEHRRRIEELKQSVANNLSVEERSEVTKLVRL